MVKYFILFIFFIMHTLNAEFIVFYGADKKLYSCQLYREGLTASEYGGILDKKDTLLSLNVYGNDIYLHVHTKKGGQKVIVISQEYNADRVDTYELETELVCFCVSDEPAPRVHGITKDLKYVVADKEFKKFIDRGISLESAPIQMRFYSGSLYLLTGNKLFYMTQVGESLGALTSLRQFAARKGFSPFIGQSSDLFVHGFLKDVNIKFHIAQPHITVETPKEVDDMCVCSKKVYVRLGREIYVYDYIAPVFEQEPPQASPSPRNRKIHVPLPSPSPRRKRSASVNTPFQKVFSHKKDILAFGIIKE